LWLSGLAVCKFASNVQQNLRLSLQNFVSSEAKKVEHFMQTYTIGEGTV
jgi:hypothetical protein